MFFEPTKRGTKFRLKPELSVVEREAIPFELITLSELHQSIGEEFIFDVECYINYFLVVFRSVKTKRVCWVEMSPGEKLNIELLKYMVWRFCLIGFNSKKYDMLMLAGALHGLDCGQLKELSDDIIKGGLRENECAEKWGFKLLRKVNEYDLIEVAPLAESLKKYAARMHAKRLQELPYPEHAELQPAEKVRVREYCVVDTENTDLLRNELTEQIALRLALSEAHGGIDLRSKSDAQIAEAVIIGEIQTLRGRRPYKPEFDPNYVFAYKAPQYVQFQSEQLREVLKRIDGMRFSLLGNGQPSNPDIGEILVALNGRQYALGLGGLHSQEKSQTVIAAPGWNLEDIDFESYYPKLILNNGWYPVHLGPAFLDVYLKIVSQRLMAKARAKACKEAGDKEGEKYWKVQADSLKITINGSFGKLGSMFSMLYSPDLLVQTTITGQLTLLMAIEAFEINGIEVVTANTDGFVVHYPDEARERVRWLVKSLEDWFNMKTEQTPYKMICARDVNNYIAIKPDGEVKVKGVYSERGSTGNTRLSKNPEALIVADSLAEFLTKGTPIANTIRNCRQIERFVIVRQVKGGGHINGRYLGKTVRWIYAKGSSHTINYIESGNTVATSEGAFPLMDLPQEFPTVLDYDRYISLASDALIDIGFKAKPGMLF